MEEIIYFGFSYTVWTFVSVVANILYHIYEVDIWISFIPDSAHTYNHVATMILQYVSLYSNFLHSNSIHTMICNTSHLGFFSSILSSLRTIAYRADL